jgi:hypothetical protein
MAQAPNGVVLDEDWGCGRVALRRTLRCTLERKVAEHRNDATLRRFGLLNSQDQSSVEENRPPE